MIKLDYTIQSPEERRDLVEKIIEENPNLTPNYLEILADYLVLAMEKQEHKQRKILTDNRLVTINKRETSFEGLASQLENGEDGIYNLTSDSKYIIFYPKIQITQKDLDSIPTLHQLRETIDSWALAQKKTSGKDAYTIKKSLIEMRKDQYLIKQAYQKPIILKKKTRSQQSYISLEDNSYLDPTTNEIVIQGISLMNPTVVKAILSNYSKLKEDCWDSFTGDIWYLLQDFDEVSYKALSPYPHYLRITELKIDKLQNCEIRHILQQEFGLTYSIEYISNLWCNKIPKLISNQAKIQFVLTQNLPLKTCSKCGRRKPAHNLFFSKNNTSRDGWYSLCKDCRNKKKENT